MDAENCWNRIVVSSLLTNKSLDIKTVNDFTTFKSLFLKQNTYEAIFELIVKNDQEKIKAFESVDIIGFGQYLYLIKFIDQNKKPYVMTVYDSDELWQDPEIIDIFPNTIYV